MDCSPPGSSVHGILQARILEWVAISFSRGSSQPRSPALQADALTSETPGKTTKIKQCRKNICPFLLESRRPLSPQGLQTPFSAWGALDFLSTYLGIDCQSYIFIGKYLYKWTTEVQLTIFFNSQMY